jgi:EAL domain-containing protein (putative c-di-GMP-specific phosphodiesterase class I)
MSPKPPPPGDRDSDEISVVIKALREADLRLEELTSREVDTVSDRDGRSVSTIINLAHSMELNVVAEGVETEEQSRLLRLLNCDEVQGYWFGRPVPSDVFEAKYLGATVLSE